MKQFVSHSDELVAWAAERIHFIPRADVKSFGLMSEKGIHAVTLYDNFSECDCNIHIASDGTRHWLSRQYLNMSFYYPFVQWNLRRVTGLVPAKNADALRFDLHLGFEREGYLKQALPDDDLIVLGMTRDRFINDIQPKFRRFQNAQ